MFRPKHSSQRFRRYKHQATYKYKSYKVFIKHKPWSNNINYCCKQSSTLFFSRKRWLWLSGYQGKQSEDSWHRPKQHKNILLHDANKASLNTGALRLLLFKSDERTVTNYRLLGHINSIETKTERDSLVLFQYSEFQKEDSNTTQIYKGQQEGNVIEIKNSRDYYFSLFTRKKRPTDCKQDSVRWWNKNYLQEGLNLPWEGRKELLKTDLM